MCFSAGASFTAGVFLAVIGTETLRKVHKPSQIVFAGIPLFFAFQQFTEGVLWLTIGADGYGWLQSAATHIFLLMAQIIWPLVVPVSVLLMEKKKPRKKILIGLLAAGGAVALYYSYSLVFYRPYAEISRFHIAYQSTFHDPYSKIAIALYLAATLVPLFISSINRTYILGAIVGVSFLVSVVFYTKCLTSVWCFFAAVISLVVYYIIRDAHKKNRIDILAALKKIPLKMVQTAVDKGE
jgi:hypothetical protein